ncbi:MAG: hypothetical protein LAP21_06275 [Acidobacteriia bacterium]|nr:hypothetical protein [Terriglobia bacterium]
MSRLSGFSLTAVIFVSLILTGCGGGSSHFAPPPAGPFSNATFNGTYAIAFSGTNTGGFFSLVGSVQANGNGQVTGGVVDVNTASGVLTSQSVTGTYTVRANGQALALLTTPSGNFNIAFVMISAQRALVIRFDNSATASGTIDRQDTTAFTATTLQGTFAFNISGVDASGLAMGSAGNFTGIGGGTIPSGVQDFNDNGTINTNLALSGAYALGAANGRGTVALSTSLGTLNFVFYVVDANHLKLMETDTVPVLAGDAFRQQGTFSNASLSGAAAFTVGGAQGNNPYAAGGIFSADGAGNITSGVEDINNGGTVTRNLALTGTYSIAASGRGTLTLNTGTGSSNFVIYPSTGGLQMLEVDITVITSGAAINQQAGPFSAASLAGGFGLNLTGATFSGEVDQNSQFTMDGSSHVTGSLDVNNVGVLSSGLSVNGTYTLGPDGHGTMILQSSLGTQNFAIYAVSNGHVLFIEIDSNLISQGDIEHQ